MTTWRDNVECDTFTYCVSYMEGWLRSEEQWMKHPRDMPCVFSLRELIDDVRPCNKGSRKICRKRGYYPSRMKRVYVQLWASPEISAKFRLTSQQSDKYTYTTNEKNENNISINFPDAYSRITLAAIWMASPRTLRSSHWIYIHRRAIAYFFVFEKMQLDSYCASKIADVSHHHGALKIYTHISGR